VSFSYDPLGRRIKKSSSAATSVFAYDGDNLIEESNSSGRRAGGPVFGLKFWGTPHSSRLETWAKS
jgi:hypothetical protein